MAIKMIDNKHFSCLSTDVKPTVSTSSEVESGDFITETDTGKIFITYNGTDWIEYTGLDIDVGDAAAALNAAIPTAPTALSINQLMKAKLIYLAPITTAANTTSFACTELIGYGNDFFKGWYAYVVWDAGGATAAPQGEFKLITDYVSTTGTFTIGAYTAAHAVTDKVMIMHPSVIAPLDATFGLNALNVQIAKIPLSDGEVTWNTTALAAINTEVDTAFNTAIPASNTANSVNDILLDKLLPTIGGLSDTGAEGAVTNADTAMAYIKQLVTQLLATHKEVEYTEDHLHHKVIWYGKKADQTTNWCDAATLTPYRATSGDNTWGVTTDSAQCFSAVDTLSELGEGLVCGDFDEILIVANSSSTIYKLRLIWGTGTVAEAVTAGQFSETMYVRSSSDTTRINRRFATPKIGIDNKVWIQCWNATNDATIDFYVGVHAYDF